ncbi:16975_t:CDS:2, partial [Racocetra persica]
DRLVLHGLFNESGIKYYYPIAEATIPFRNESIDEIEESVHMLMIMRVYLVCEFVEGLLQEFTSHNNQCWESIEMANPASISESLQKVAYQASVARKNSINTKRKVILSWGRYSERFEDKVIELRSENKNPTGKTARNRIYNEMKPYPPGISGEYLRVMTCKARKINKLFGYEYDLSTLKKINDLKSPETTTEESTEIQ